MKKESRSQSKQCFFITPIGNAGSEERRRADWIFEEAVKPAAVEAGLSADRADLMFGSAMIGTNIFRAIAEAPVCIADLSGLNPNVLYEIGVRHTLRLPIIHIAQNGTPLPFDTATHFTHFYDLSEWQSMRDLKSHLTAEAKRIKDPSHEVSNPFTQALGTIEISRSGDPRDTLIASLSKRVEDLETKSIPLPNASRAAPAFTIDDKLVAEILANREFKKRAAPTSIEAALRQVGAALKDNGTL